MAVVDKAIHVVLRRRIAAVQHFTSDERQSPVASRQSPVASARLLALLLARTTNVKI